MTTSRRRWSFTLRTLFVVVGVATIPLAWITSLYYGYQKSLRDFPRRHLEANKMIEGIYAEYRRNGHWPAKADFDAIVRDRMPNDWCGECDPSLGGPCISLHGPFHSAIVYYFLPLQGESAPTTWVLSVEGSKSKFQADVDYSAGESTPEGSPATEVDRP